MPLFRNQWDSENYPSYQDYLEAKKNGTLKVNKKYLDPSLSANPDQSRYEAEQQEHRHSTRDSGKTSAQKKVASYGQPKPFTQGKLTEKKSGKSARGVFFLIALIVGFAPTVIELIKEATPVTSIESAIESFIGETAGTKEADLPFESKITTALPSDYLYVMAGDVRDNPGISISGITKEPLTAKMGNFEGGSPYLDLYSGEDTTQGYFALDLSAFRQDPEADKFFTDKGALKEGARIEALFTDLSRDGITDLLVYYNNGTDYPYVEVYLGLDNSEQPLAPLDYFESYETINITDQGNIQRIDENGNVYDEIEVSAEGLNVISK